MVSMDSTFAVQLPTWLMVTGALSIFWYQTLDAIDGKQARRTGTSGPLGQLFDHGCDAISTTMITLALNHGLLIGRETNLFYFFITLIGSHVSRPHAIC